tara:strand:- start:225 stop:467 length:243 start_codon:yes stop_codon:yes gene_type:complete
VQGVHHGPKLAHGPGAQERKHKLRKVLAAVHALHLSPSSVREHMISVWYAVAIVAVFGTARFALSNAESQYLKVDDTVPV